MNHIIKDISSLIKNAALLFALVFTLFLFGMELANCQEIDECIECHMDKNLTRTDAAGKFHSQYVNKQEYLQSVPGKQGWTCVKCHVDVKTDTHPEEGIPDVSCGNADCHTEVKEEYDKSKHGLLLSEGDPDAPECYDCHSKHFVLPVDDPDSAINPENISNTCRECHEEQAINPIFSLIATRFKGHGKVDASCNFSTKHCIDCHFEVGKHGNSKLEPKKCVQCHLTNKSNMFFGTIHKSGLLTSPFLLIMLGLLYLTGIAGLIFYFKTGSVKKANGKQVMDNNNA